MKATIVTIANRGDIAHERVHVSVLADTTLSYFIMLKTSDLSGLGVRNGVLDAFWFPSIAVKAGDQVVLYSRSGVNSSEKGSGSSTNYFFYAGLVVPQWVNADDRAVLVEAQGWETSKA